MTWLREQTPRDVLALPPDNQEQFIDTVEMLWHIELPRIAVCVDEGHVSQAEALWRLFSGDIHDALVVGSRGSGKTQSLVLLQTLSAWYDGDDALWLSAIEQQAQKAEKYFRSFLAHPDIAPGVETLVSAEVRLRNGGEVLLGPCTVNRANSSHVLRVLLDEAALVNPDVLSELRLVPIARGDRQGGIVITSSRKQGYGLFERLIADATESKTELMVWCQMDVTERCPPTRHLEGIGCNTCPLADICRYDGLEDGPGRLAYADSWTPIRSLERIRAQVDCDTFDSQVLSLRASRRGLVYPDWNEARHVAAIERDPERPVVAGMDLGYSNATAILFAFVDANDRIIVFAEMYESHVTSSEWAKRIKAIPWVASIDALYADPAAADARAVLREHGIRVTPADNDIDSGLAKVRYLIENDLLVVHPRCKNLRRELLDYHVIVPAGDSANATEKPKKADDHACDALRYLCAALIGHALVY